MVETRDKSKDTFPRWQKTTLDQMGYFINLLIFLCVGSTGFCASKLLDCYCLLSCCSETLIIIGIIILLIGLFCLLCLQFNRLQDFRITAQLARSNDVPTHLLSDNKDNLRNKVTEMGMLTWRLLGISIFLFALGHLFIVLGFLIEIITN